MPSESTSPSPQDPPRKLRRLRELALKDASSSSNEFQLSPFPASVASSPSPSAAPAPRRRGRKPAGPLSKTAREQLRKTNHSVIEKRRREKINEALAALRQLVPNEKAHDPEKKEKEDREFKLEVLVRTVDYLRMMVDKMKKLENGMCVNCGGELAPDYPAASGSTLPSPIEPERLPKRKRTEYEEEYDSEHEEDGQQLDNKVMEARQSPVFLLQVPNALASASAEQGNRIRLPSISSWMANASSSSISHLPSPPQSVTFAPTAIVTGYLPGLVLPPPIRSQPDPDARPCNNPTTARNAISYDVHASPSIVSSSTLGSKHSLFRANSSPVTPRRKAPQDVGGALRKSRSINPSPLPSHSHSRASSSSSSRWSRDDQTAASLLLNFSSRPSSSPEGYDEGRRDEHESNKAQRQAPYPEPLSGALEAHTPSSMLGMPFGGT